MNVSQKLQQIIIISVFTVFLTMAASAAYANGEGSHGLQVKTPFMGILTYGQVPNPEPDAIPSNASGMFFGSFDHLRRVLVFSITYRDLRGQLDKAHFHGPAPTGVVQTKHLFDICCKEDDPYDEQPEGSMGTFNGETPPLGPLEIWNLMNGLYYINIHSDLYPTGEIRGQVLPSGTFYFRVVP